MTEGNGVEIGAAYVTILPDGSKIGPEVKKSFGVMGPEADKAGKTAGKRFGGVFNSTAGKLIGAAGGVFAARELTGFLKDSVGEAREAAIVGRRTNNVIAKMGGVSKVSAREVGNLAGALSAKSGFDDEAIQSGENLLLTFGNLRNEAGKGNKIFDRTTALMVDMSAAMGTDFKGSAIQLGKALNDPVKGISALSRVGVSFTEQQKNQIKALTKSGETLRAQKLILREVEKQFGGAAQAMADPSKKLEVAFGNLKEQIGTALLPEVDRFQSFLTKKGVPAISGFLDEMQSGKGKGGQAVKLFKEIRDDAEKAAEYVGKIGKAFDDLPDPVKKGLIGGAAGLFVAKKTGLTGLIGRPGGRGGGSGLLGLATAARPLPVFVVNEGFGNAGNVLGGPPKGNGGKGVGGVLPFVNPTTAAIASSVFIATHVDEELPASKLLKDTTKLLPQLEGMFGKGMDKSATGLLSASEKFDKAMSKTVKGNGAAAFGAFQRTAERAGLSVDELGALLPKTAGKINDLGGRANYAKTQTDNWRTTILGTNKQLDRLDAKNPRVKVWDNIAAVDRRAQQLSAHLDSISRNAHIRLAISSGGTGFGLQARANGGPIEPNRPYLVGERGPELRTFGRPGYIVPNDQLGRSGVNFNGPITVEAHDYDDFTRQLQSRARRAQMGGF